MSDITTAARYAREGLPAAWAWATDEYGLYQVVPELKAIYEGFSGIILKFKDGSRLIIEDGTRRLIAR